MFILILLILNAVVLLGQIWPDGAPTFAKPINIITLGLNVSFLLTMIKGPKRPGDRGVAPK